MIDKEDMYIHTERDTERRDNDITDDESDDGVSNDDVSDNDESDDEPNGEPNDESDDDESDDITNNKVHKVNISDNEFNTNSQSRPGEDNKPEIVYITQSEANELNMIKNQIKEILGELSITEGQLHAIIYEVYKRMNRNAAATRDFIINRIIDGGL